MDFAAESFRRYGSCTCPLYNGWEKGVDMACPHHGSVYANLEERVEELQEGIRQASLLIVCGYVEAGGASCADVGGPQCLACQWVERYAVPADNERTDA